MKTDFETNDIQKGFDFADYLCHNEQSELAELIKNRCVNAISVTVSSVLDSDIPVGTSKSGGFPDLPPEIPYPFMGKFTSFRKDSIDSYPKSAMQLAAQINLAEVAPLDNDKLLPHKGMLYFFWSGEPVNLSSNFPDSKNIFYEGCSAPFKVIYYDGDISRLRRVKPDMPYYTKYFDGPLESFRYSFETSRGEYDPERYKDELGEFYDKVHDFREKGTKLLGFPEGLDEKILGSHLNLFQFSTEVGNVRRLFWCISRSALEKRNFDEVYFKAKTE